MRLVFGVVVSAMLSRHDQVPGRVRIADLRLARVD
jgi:hypothetical protein